jgi:NADPH-dependent ferric siderophore reductase
MELLTPRLVRVTLAGPELADLVVDAPAASVRLLLPAPGARAVVLPVWNGNEFRFDDGRRPPIRTLTPWQVRGDELELGVVVHGRGQASQWAASAATGDLVAVSGPGRGYAIDPDATAFVVLGDETAIPAIAQLLEALPAGADVVVDIEVAAADAELDLPRHPGASVAWHLAREGDPPGDRLLAALVARPALTDGVAVWAAGEAAAMQRIRRHLFETRGLSRRQATVRGYWKHGRAGGTDDE